MKFKSFYTQKISFILCNQYGLSYIYDFPALKMCWILDKIVKMIKIWHYTTNNFQMLIKCLRFVLCNKIINAISIKFIEDF